MQISIPGKQIHDEHQLTDTYTKKFSTVTPPLRSISEMKLWLFSDDLHLETEHTSEKVKNWRTHFLPSGRRGSRIAAAFQRYGWKFPADTIRGNQKKQAGGTRFQKDNIRYIL